MPDTPTPRLGLPKPSLTDPHDVPFDIGGLADKLDQVTATFLSGPASALPPPGVPGRLFLVTDQATILYDTGATWLQPGYSPGDLKLAASGVATVGWLVCDGTAVARTAYPALFAAIGTVWGAGDGSSTFNLPDLRGRALMGAGQGAGLSARALGALIGVETVALTVAQMPAHGHGNLTGNHDRDHTHYVSGTTGADSPDHVHGMSLSANNIPVTQSGPSGAAVLGGGSNTYGASARHAHSFAASTGGVSTGHYHAITSEGGGATHTNVQPSAALTMLIKT